VADTQNRRIQVFDSDGEFQRMIYTGGLPRGVAIAPTGLLVVSDNYNHNVSIYTPQGKVLQQYGIRGYKRGQFESPTDIALDGKSGWVFIVDLTNNRVDVWAPKPSQ